MSGNTDGITEDYVNEQVSKGKPYFLVLLKRGPGYDRMSGQKLQMEHLQRLFRLRQEGKISLTGPVTDDADIRGIEICNLSDIEEVKKLTESDPAVKVGRLIYEVHPWFGIPGDTLP